MFANHLIEPALLIVIGICGAVLSWIFDDVTLTFIFAFAAVAGVYEYRATVLHQQDLKKFERQ
ncbi:hypothetical protein ACSFA8_20785 [Variovorax sp. RT4R15]|uniref:hypothetical protein n=1 Tax=Variovorax sp. RT4R15 TaxID=3443737 RepID=UPI003F46CC14